MGSLATVDERKRPAGSSTRRPQRGRGAIAERRRRSTTTELARRVELERLDLTEHAGKPRRGHAHIVTQAWERLEDVFIGLGFEIAEGPEVETDWHNFEALNMDADHPARSDFDTLFVDHLTPDGRSGNDGIAKQHG